MTAPLRSRIKHDWLARLVDSDVQPFDLVRERSGWTGPTIEELEATTDQDLPDLHEAVELLHRTISTGGRIAVITDYDMDGVAAGLLAYAGLAELGADVGLVIPHYTGPRDVTSEKVSQARRQYPGTELIISCDVGINSNDGIDEAHRHGIGFIVADHHIEGQDLCRADAVVDPNRTDCDYSEPEICGSQVALHILNAYAARHRRDKVDQISQLSLFGGIGGLADVMPLRGQTRALVRRAVALMTLAMPDIPVYTEADTKREHDPVKFWQVGRWNLEDPTAIDPDSSTLMRLVLSQHHAPAYVELFRGVSLLLRELVVAGKVSSVENLDHSFLGFTFTPMFNATRRIEGDMADSFAIFAPQAVRASRPDHRPSEDDLSMRIAGAQQIIANNELRKALTEEAMAQIAERDQPMAPYIWYSDAVPGILGLLASKLLEANGVPTVVVHPDRLAGSARAPEWMDVLGTTAALGIDGLVAAGHHQACGVRSRDLSGLQALAAAFDHAVVSLPEPSPEDLRADLHMIDIESVHEITEAQAELLVDAGIDMVMPSKNALVELAEQISRLEPFGRGFAAPDVRVTFQPAYATIALMSPREGTRAGSEDPADYKHLKIVTGHGLQLLWWNKAEEYERLRATRLVTASIQLGINAFAGSLKPQGIVSSISVLA